MYGVNFLYSQPKTKYKEIVSDFSKIIKLELVRLLNQ